MAALRTNMTLDQRRTREETKSYMLHLEVVIGPHSSDKVHRWALLNSSFDRIH